MALWIGISRTTMPELFATDTSGTLSHGEAAAAAERYNQIALQRVRLAFPQAEVELVDGNGLNGFKVLADDGGDDEDATQSVRVILDAIWEAGDFWDIN